jgi:hypothetical protein
LVLLYCVLLAGEILMEMDTSDSNKEYARHFVGEAKK